MDRPRASLRYATHAREPRCSRRGGKRDAKRNIHHCVELPSTLLCMVTCVRTLRARRRTREAPFGSNGFNNQNHATVRLNHTLLPLPSIFNKGVQTPLIEALH